VGIRERYAGFCTINGIDYIRITEICMSFIKLMSLVEYISEVWAMEWGQG
jgi:hypothetical protein